VNFTVLLAHNVPGAAFGGAWQESDAGVMAEVEAVSRALSTLGIGHEVRGVASAGELAGALSASGSGLVFNLVEQLPGGPMEACRVPDICAAAGRRCTGSGSECLALCLDKGRTKDVLAEAGVKAPAGLRAGAGGEPDYSLLPAGKVIVKPADTDASEGIGADSVLDSRDPALPEVVKRVSDRSGGRDVLVESYITGREVNVSLFEDGGGLRTMPLAEIDFSAFPPGMTRIVDYTAKWKTDSFEYLNTPRVIPAPFEESVARRIRVAAAAAWLAAGCRGYARVDFRVSADGTPWVLEVNPNPDISPDAGFAAALKAGGVEYASFVEAVVKNALSPDV